MLHSFQYNISNLKKDYYQRSLRIRDPFSFKNYFHISQLWIHSSDIHQTEILPVIEK